MEKKEIDGNTTTEKITTIIDQPKTVGNTSAITVENGTELTIGEVRTVTVNQPQIAGASSAITVENGTVLTSVHDNDNDNMLQECLDVFASYIIVVDQYLKEGAEELADYNGDNWGRELVAECAQGYLGRGGNVSVGRIAGVIGKSIWDLGSGVSAGSITMVSHPLETIENVPAALGDVATTYVDGNWTQKLELTLEIAGIFNGFAKLKRMGKSSATEAGKLAGAEETVGAIDGVVGEAGGIVGSEGVAAVEGAAGEAAEAIEGTAGKGKIRIESAGESGSKTISDLSNKAVKHPMNDHMPARYAKQLQYMSKEGAEQYLNYKTFFNSNWTDEQVRAALNFGYKEALNSGVTTGKYSFKYLGENVTVYLEDGIFKTGYGDYVYTYDELVKLLGGE